MNDIDLGRLIRALDQHMNETLHPERYHEELGLLQSCDGYCAPDIARRYGDQTLMELTDAEEAAEAATWD